MADAQVELGAEVHHSSTATYRKEWSSTSHTEESSSLLVWRALLWPIAAKARIPRSEHAGRADAARSLPNAWILRRARIRRSRHLIEELHWVLVNEMLSRDDRRMGFTENLFCFPHDGSLANRTAAVARMPLLNDSRLLKSRISRWRDLLAVGNEHPDDTATLHGNGRLLLPAGNAPAHESEAETH